MRKTTIIVLAVCAAIGFADRLDAADPVIPEADVPAPPVEQIGIWGAIAYSVGDGRQGFSWGMDKRSEAEQDALDHCRNAGGEVCEVSQVFRNHRHWNDDDGSGFPYNHCAALAVDADARESHPAWGSASAGTRKGAEDAALAQCSQNGKQCRIRKWVCT